MIQKKQLLAVYLRSEIRKMKMDLLRFKFQKKAIEKILYTCKKERSQFQREIAKKNFINNTHEDMFKKHLSFIPITIKVNHRDLKVVLSNIAHCKKKNTELHVLCDIYHIRVKDEK